MSLIYEERSSDSPYIELITQGRTISQSTTIRPGEICWHMVFINHEGVFQPLLVGPLLTSGVVSFIEDVELLWVKFKLGVFMPHLPLRDFVDEETTLPEACGTSFWLKGSAWQPPTYENVETFVSRLVKQDILAHDPLIPSALNDHPLDIPARTMRHRFLRATGLTQGHIRQMNRAQQAAARLQHGTPILDVVYELGYYDQPHLTRDLKRFLGYTPAQFQPHPAEV